MALRLSVQLGPAQLPKRENKIENVTEPLKAMARAMKAKKAQLIEWGEKPRRNAIELRKLRPIPGPLNSKIERQRVLDVVVQLQEQYVLEPGTRT